MARPRGYRVSEASRAKLRATIHDKSRNFVARPQRKPNPSPAAKLLTLLQQALLSSEPD